MLGPSALFGDHAAGDGREAGSAHADLIEALSRLAALAESRDAWRVHDAMAALNNALRNVRASSSRSTWRDVGAMVRAHDAGRLLREDPITRRSVKKPRGYAGDAALLDLIYDGWDRATGPRAAAAQAIHDHVYASPSCVAVTWIVVFSSPGFSAPMIIVSSAVISDLILSPAASIWLR